MIAYGNYTDVFLPVFGNIYEFRMCGSKWVVTVPSNTRLFFNKLRNVVAAFTLSMLAVLAVSPATAVIPR